MHSEQLLGGDEEVVRIKFEEIDQMEFFADHMDILTDYIQSQSGTGKDDVISKSKIQRSVCPSE